MWRSLYRRFNAIVAASLAVAVGQAAAVGGTPTDRSFTYQGQLKKSGAALTGSADFIFTLWDNSAGGVQIGSTLQLFNANLTAGLLTVDLDFGPNTFNGDGRWLQIQVRNPAGAGGYTLLNPRQPILPA